MKIQKVFFIVEVAKETVLDFSQGIVKIIEFYFRFNIK